MRRLTIADFWNWVDRSAGQDGCWPWTGPRFPHGYGQFGSTGQGHDTHAHRVAYTAAYGKIPPGVVCRHTCDNPPCCNPRHLALGTQQDNVNDCIARGRYRYDKNYACGSRMPQSRLTEDSVLLIRSLPPPPFGPTLEDLGRRFGVTGEAVAKARQGKTWKHLNGRMAPIEGVDSEWLKQLQQSPA